MSYPFDLEMNTFSSTHLSAKDSHFGTDKKNMSCSTDALPRSLSDKSCPRTDPALQRKGPPTASANKETPLWRPKTFRETMDLLLSSFAERDNQPPPAVNYTTENETNWSHDTSSNLSECWSESLDDSCSSATSSDLDHASVRQDVAPTLASTDRGHPPPDSEKQAINGSILSTYVTGWLCDETSLKEEQHCKETVEMDTPAEPIHDAKIKETVSTETENMETEKLTELLHEAQDFINGDHRSYLFSEEANVTGAQQFVDLEEGRPDMVDDVDGTTATSCDDSATSMAEESAASTASASPLPSPPAPLPAQIRQPEYLKYYLTVCYKSTSHKTQDDCRAEGYRCCRGRPLRVTLDRHSLSNQPGYLVVREEEEEVPLPRANVPKVTTQVAVQTPAVPLEPDYLPYRLTQCYRSSRHTSQTHCFYDGYRCCRGNPLRVTVNRHSISRLPGHYELRTEDLSEEQWNRLFNYEAPACSKQSPNHHYNNDWRLSYYDRYNVADHYYGYYGYHYNNEYGRDGYYGRSLWSWQQPAVEWKSSKGVVTGVMKQGLTAVSPPPRTPVPFEERPVKASAPPRNKRTWSAHEEFAHAVKSQGHRIVPKSGKCHGFQRTCQQLETLFEEYFEES